MHICFCFKLLNICFSKCYNIPLFWVWYSPSDTLWLEITFIAHTMHFISFLSIVFINYSACDKSEIFETVGT